MAGKVKMNKVDSSQLKSVGWQPGAPTGTAPGTLYITFLKGGTYKYENVPERIFLQLMNAQIANSRIGDQQMSIGSLFHSLVKSHPNEYPYKKISA